MDFNEFISWEYLLTFAGCMACTGVVTQFVKGWVDKLVHIPTQALAYVVALVVLLAAQAFTGGAHAEHGGARPAQCRTDRRCRERGLRRHQACRWRKWVM